MPTVPDELIHQILALSPDQQVEVLERIEESLESQAPQPARLPDAWREVVKERLREIDAGESEFFTYEEVIEGLMKGDS